MKQSTGWRWPLIWTGERGGWWRFLATILVTKLSWILGLYAMVLAKMWIEESLGHRIWDRENVSVSAQLLVRGFTLIPIFCGLTGLLLSIRFLHNQRFTYAFTDGRQFRLALVFQSAGVWVLLWFASLLVFPEGFDRFINEGSVLQAAVVLVWAAAFFFLNLIWMLYLGAFLWGYLQPRIGAWVKRPWVVVSIVSLVSLFEYHRWGGVKAHNAYAWIFMILLVVAQGAGAVRAGTIAPVVGMAAAIQTLYAMFGKSWRAPSPERAGLFCFEALVWLGWLWWITRTKSNDNSRKIEPSGEETSASLRIQA